MLWQIRIWRVAFLSNFAATSINLFYAATEQVSLRSRLYCLHLEILVSYFSSFLKKNLLSNKPPDGGSVCASSCQYDRQFHLVDFVFRDTLERLLFYAKYSSNHLVELWCIRCMYLLPNAMSRAWLPYRPIAHIKLQARICTAEFVLACTRYYW